MEFRQAAIKRRNSTQTRCTDLVLFINGIPLVVIEASHFGTSASLSTSVACS
jgi:type I site-specific restriction-modification system R (restriction) subunit